MGNRWAIPVSLIVLLLPLMLSPELSVPLSDPPSDLNIGPYVDKIVYQVIASQDQRIAAILAGTVETDMSFFNPSNLPLITGDPHISIAENLRNGYGHITINCRDYPLNISGFRRAFAYAYDKRAVQQDIMLGYSQLHDSLVPATSSFSIEDDLEWHYYDVRPEIGNQILDDLGFTIQGDGWRTAPNGSPIDIEVLYGTGGISSPFAQLGVDALESLHVRAHSRGLDFHTYISTLDSHGEYDMIYYATNFYGTDVDWLAYSYWSEFANVANENPSNFQNATYDSYRDALLTGTTYEEVYEAAAEMQRILHYNVPLLIVYENIYMQAYRNDMFEGHVDDLGRYIAGPWTARKVHKIDGTAGGTFTIALGEEPDSFNFFNTTSYYATPFFLELYPSLYMYAPDQSPYPYLAENLIIENHADNPSVTDGNTRFTIDIIQNATWTDGTPLTAADVAFTFNYIIESGTYENPAAAILWDLAAAYTPTPYRVILEFQTESYWHFSKVAYQYIIPRHIFNDETGIGYANWDNWNPGFDPAWPHVTGGPFILSDFEPGETYTLSTNLDFAFIPQEEYPPPDHTTTSPDTSTPTESPTGTNGVPNDPVVLAARGIAGASSVVIVVMVVLIIREKGVT